jgi:hypothetical protein
VKRKRLTKAEREERDRERGRVLANAERLRELAEHAQAKLDLQENYSVQLSFLGSAWIDQGGQTFDVAAALFAEGKTPAWSFFGHYWNAVPAEVRSGQARLRFSDGSEANAVLAGIDPDRGGFRIRGRLEDTAELMKTARM